MVKIFSMVTLEYYTDRIEKGLKEIHYREQPANLYEPVRYILNLGGKRIRPALLLMSAALFSDDIEGALPAALALEVFHNFTLMHDDIMDKADVRRSKATVHKVWNNNTAILSGDATLIIAYDQLLKLPKKDFFEIFKVFNQTALEVCEGQQYDMDFETRNDVSIQEYLEMIRLKTSVLIASALKIGAIIGGASEADQESLYKIGEYLGLAFQLQDDYLDVYSNAEKFGKQNGGDIVNNKKTYLLISALNSNDKEAVNELNKWISKTTFNKDEKVRSVKLVYDKINIASDTKEVAQNYFNSAIDILDKLDVEPSRKKPIKDIIDKLMCRET